MCFKGRHVRVHFQGKINLNLQEGGHKSSVYHFSYKWREYEVLHIFMTFVIAVSVWDGRDGEGGTKKELENEKFGQKQQTIQPKPLCSLGNWKIQFWWTTDDWIRLKKNYNTFIFIRIITTLKDQAWFACGLCPDFLIALLHLLESYMYLKLLHL